MVCSSCNLSYGSDPHGCMLLSDVSIPRPEVSMTYATAA